jgi:MoaA/NifB/PqqE/SkfB family radical SAM enzyme
MNSLSELASTTKQNDFAYFRELNARLGTLKAANYDVASKCNLRCEGCLFFEGEENEGHEDSRSLAEWDALFAADAARGVTLAYMAGAEPSLVPDRLRAAQKHIPHGIVFTNGTIRLPDDIFYRIHISSWGVDEIGSSLRAGDVLTKAMNNYRDDPRAVCVFTITSLNINQIMIMAELANSHGLPLTFSYFSPTTRYLDKLENKVDNDKAYFRISSATQNLALTQADFAHARAEIVRAMLAYPETVQYSLHYNDWVTGDKLYDIDPVTKIAKNCGFRITKQVHVHVDHQPGKGKCCSSNIDCSNCRAYAMGQSTYLSRIREAVRKPEELAKWLEVREIWAKLFLNANNLDKARL